MKIDTHTHLMPKNLPDWSKKFGYGSFIHLDHHRDGFARMMQGEKFFREIASNCWDPALRIEEYATFQTKVQVVCTIPVLFAYWAKPEDCMEVSRFLNDDLAEAFHKFPKNYVGLATLPMQDPELAVKEIDRCRKIGFRGIQIGSNVNGKNLNEPFFFPIWEALEKNNMCVLVHPWEMMGQDQMARYWLPWLVGMPAETSRAVCSLIFGGIFDKFPGIRFNFAHAGGSFIPTIGRIEHGFNCRPDLVALDNPVNPREYLGKFWVDSATHDPQLLKYIIEVVGSEKITLGTDYPFPLGDLEIGKFISEMDITQEDRDNIFYKAPLEWLGMSESDFL
ncbi:MAG: amidohydrolase family protein [Flavobacteriales bacterium]|nr:amidohydrolase family protein [Flavobacteriales bacterium]